MPGLKWKEDVNHLERLIAEAKSRRKHSRNRSRDRRMLSSRLFAVDDPVREIRPVQDHVGEILCRSWTKGNRDDITSLSVGLAGLWEVSRVHIQLLGELLDVDAGIHERELTELSRSLFVNWFSNAFDHMKSLKRPLSRLAGLEGAFYQVSIPRGKTKGQNLRSRSARHT